MEKVTIGAWTHHPGGADVTVIPLLGESPLMLGREVDNIEIFVGEVGAVSEQEMQSIGEGLGVFLIGYPLGLAYPARNDPIVRAGVIARVQEWVAGDADTFLVDSPTFPGSSGSPVVIRPDTTAIQGTTPITHALLLGIARGRLPSEDQWVSQQTGELRMLVSEYTGLSESVAISAIKGTVSVAARLLPLVYCRCRTGTPPRPSPSWPGSPKA